MEIGKLTVALEDLALPELKELIAEVEYLRHFYAEADFGPADSDVRDMINDTYANPLPEGY